MRRTVNQNRSTQLESHRRSGFVLLVVLAAIVVAGAALSALATASLDCGVDALAAQDDLQRRWGITACERLLLPRASELFEWQDEARKAGGRIPTPPGVIREQIVLGGQTFDLILADEDAKADLNALYHAGDTRHVEQALRKLCGPLSQRFALVQPTVPSAAGLRRQTARQSEEEDAKEPLLPPAFRTWGDVFDVSAVRIGSGDDRMLATLTSNITLWGTGRLNIDRARDEVVIAVCGAVIQEGLARRLVDRYRDNSEAVVRLLIEKEVKNGEDSRRLQELIGEGSSTYSLWTEVTSRRYRVQKFAVLHADEEGALKTFKVAL